MILFSDNSISFGEDIIYIGKQLKYNILYPKTENSPIKRTLLNEHH